MKSLIAQRIKASAAGAAEHGYGMTGAYGERYEPESRQEFVDASIDRVWTARCISLISKSMTQVDMQVKTGSTDADWQDEHPLIDLLRRPHSADPALMFFEWSVRWAETIGEWYWEVVPSRRGAIAELFPLQGHKVRIEPDEDTGETRGFIYDPNMNGIDVVKYSAPVAGVAATDGPEGRPIAVAGRYANPKDDFYGLAPLRSAKDPIISEYYGVRYDHRFFRNSARPDVVIGFKGKRDKEQKLADKKNWNEFKGVDNSHRAMVLDNDPSVHLLSQNPKDVEYLEGRYLSREEQCAAFGVPPVLVGDLRRATYSNYEVAEYIFWKDTMLEKLEFFATWANFVLLPYFPDVRELGFDVSEITALQKAEGWRSERVQGEVAGGLLTPNEGRERFDREPMDEAGADDLWMPTKSRPISIANKPPDPAPGAPTPPSPPGPGETPAAEGDPDPVAAAAKAAGLSVKEAFRVLEKTTVTTWIRNASEAKARFSERAKEEIAKLFTEQAKAIRAILDPDAKAGPSVGEIERLLSEYDWGEDAVKLHSVVDAMRAGLAAASFKLTERATETEAGYGLTERVLKALANRPDGIQSVAGRVKAEVLDQVRKGIEHGLTFRQIAEGGKFKSATEAAEEVEIKGVQGVYDEYTTWQAERIARSEAGVTFNRSSAALMTEAGLSEVDIIDGEDDEPCKAWNGSRKSLAEYEANPLAHPNCTRIGLPVIE
jgi:phage portal protein BeeE